MNMKQIIIATGALAIAASLVSCGGGPRRSPGSAYMPDMANSVAYETYVDANSRLANSTASGAHYTGKPVAGTMAKGDLEPFSIPKSDTSGYAGSATLVNPVDISKVDMKNTERLYLINCGICHGTKLDGNGPLYNDGKGPYSAAPKNLMGDDMKALKEGTMFYSIYYGKGAMGSYASQLSTRQIWEVIHYIKTKQGVGGAAAPAADTTANSTAAVK